MAETNESQSRETVDRVMPSTFAPQFESSRLPLSSKLQRPVVYATGDLFRLTSASTEKVADKDGSQVPRAVYHVQILNSKNLDPGTVLTIKVKWQESNLTKEQNLTLLQGKAVLVVAFDNIRLWQVGNNEGLSADAMRVLNLNPAQAMSRAPQGLIQNTEEK